MSFGYPYETPYKFNGKEKDEETGYNYYEARYYGSDLSIFLSVDELSDKYPAWTSYHYCMNNPVKFVDPDGKEVWIIAAAGFINGKATLEAYQYKNGKLYTSSGAEYKGNNSYARAVQGDLNKLTKDNPVLAKRLEAMQKSDKQHGIMMPAAGDGNLNSANKYDKESGIRTNTLTRYDPKNRYNIGGDEREPRIALAHELLGHGWDADQGTVPKGETMTGIPFSEVNAVNTENVVRKALGVKIRNYYAVGQAIAKEYLKPIE